MTKLTKEQEQALADLAVKTAKQEGVQKVRRWTDVGDGAGQDSWEDIERRYQDNPHDLSPPF